MRPPNPFAPLDRRDPRTPRMHLSLPTDRRARHIIATVAEHFDITPAAMRQRSSVRSLVWTRQVAAYLLQQQLQMSLSSIAVALGGQHHTTVLHGIQRVALMAKLKPAVADELLDVMERLHPKLAERRRSA